MVRRTEPRMLVEGSTRSGWHRDDYVATVALTMYGRHMKTITITIPDELDAEAAAEAKRRGISKSELIRRGLAAVLPEAVDSVDDNPWHGLAGFADEGLSTEPHEIDRVVYDS